MATLLMKPVTRQLMARDRFNRSVLVTIDAGDTITFRVKGKRTRVETSLHHCYVLAQLIDAEVRYKKKLDEYDAKRKAHQRAVRPRKPILLFNKMYLTALKESKKSN